MSRSKKPQTDPPERLSEIEKRRLRIWCEEHYPQYVKRLGKIWIECRDWHLKRGEQAANWEAGFRSWVRMQYKIDIREGKGFDRRPAVGSREMPQEAGQRSGELGPLFQLIEGKANARNE